MATISDMFRENRFKPGDVPRFENKLFYEGVRRRPYLEQFAVLLFLATVIATMGILGDSTATVIGAMIVAPLMTPIMATAAALVMGKTKRATQSLILVGLGVGSVVVVSWLFGNFYTDAINFEANSQITARISPRLIDLVAALASGAAGAFCLSREDIADSLPGVAISISLVPPLCVVGISLSAGEMEAATGALLLFVTNFLSILLAGGGVLVLLNLNKAAMVEVRGTARRNAFALIVAAIFLISIPLFATGQRVVQETYTEIKSRETAVDWLAGTEFEIRQVHVVGNDIFFLITGPGEPPPFTELVTDLRQVVGQHVVVSLEVVESHKEYSEDSTDTAP